MRAARGQQRRLPDLVLGPLAAHVNFFGVLRRCPQEKRERKEAEKIRERLASQESVGPSPLALISAKLIKKSGEEVREAAGKLSEAAVAAWGRPWLGACCVGPYWLRRARVSCMLPTPQLVPSPRLPTGKAFFVPLKPALRLEVPERDRSVGGTSASAASPSGSVAASARGSR